MRSFFIFSAIALLASCLKESPRTTTQNPTTPVTTTQNDTTQAVTDCVNGIAGDNYPADVGCMDMRLRASLDSFRMVDIYLNEKNLDLQTTCKSFNIADYPASDDELSPGSDIAIHYFNYGHAKDSTYFLDCDYIVQHMGYRVNWKAVSGTVTVMVSKRYKDRANNEGFKVSLNLKAVRFVRVNSTQDTLIQSLTTKDSVAYYDFLRPG